MSLSASGGTVETTITLSIPDGGMSLEALEEVVSQEVQRAGRDLLTGGCQAMERDLLGQEGERLRRDKRRPFELLTPFGCLKLIAGIRR